MSLFNRFKKNQHVTEYTEERTIPKKDIISVQTFTQAKSFRGFRRVRISTNGLDGVEKNFAYFREKDFDFTKLRCYEYLKNKTASPGIRRGRFAASSEGICPALFPDRS